MEAECRLRTSKPARALNICSKPLVERNLAYNVLTPTYNPFLLASSTFFPIILSCLPSCLTISFVKPSLQKVSGLQNRLSILSPLHDHHHSPAHCNCCGSAFGAAPVDPSAARLYRLPYEGRMIFSIGDLPFFSHWPKIFKRGKKILDKATLQWFQ